MEEFEVDIEWVSKTFNVPITGKKQTQTNNQPTVPEPLMKAILNLIKNEALYITEQKDNSSQPQSWKKPEYS